MPLMYSFPILEWIHYSISGSNCCFLICIQISQEAGKVVWYSHLFKNFPVYCDPHKDFSIVNETKVDVFLEFLAFSMIQRMLTIWSVSSTFSKSSLYIWSSQFTYCWSLAWRILSITLLACEMNVMCGSLNILWHSLSLGMEWKLSFSSPLTASEFSKLFSKLSTAL